MIVYVARGPGDPRHPTQNRLIFYVHLYTNLLFYLFELTCLFRPHADRAGGCGAPAWGITPGCSFLSFPTRSRAGFAPGILCLSALGVPYAVSLLTGGLILQLALYLTKRNPPKRSIVSSSNNRQSSYSEPSFTVARLRSSVEVFSR